MNDEQRYDNLAKLLKNLPEQKVDADFDKKFWEKFYSHTPVKPSFGFRVPAFAFASIGAVACIAAFALTHIVDQPLITLSQGKVIAKKGSLQTGDVIKTADSAWAVMEVENGYRVKIEPGSEIHIKSLKPKWLPGKTIFQLSKGQALVSIGDQVPRKYPVEIHTFNAFAKALGTQFIVAAPIDGQGPSRVTVLKGVVRTGRITNSKLISESRVDVGAGQETFISDDSVVLKPQAIIENTQQELQELFQFSKRNRAVLLISVSQDRVRELLRPCPIYIRLESKTPLARQITAIAYEIQEAQQNKSEISPSSIHEMEAAILNQNEIDPIPVLLFTGAYYASVDDYDNALRLFGMVQEKYPWSHFASLAVMAQAEVYRSYLNNPEMSALKAREVLSRYPNSVESEEAKQLLENLS